MITMVLMFIIGFIMYTFFGYVTLGIEIAIASLFFGLLGVVLALINNENT